VKLLLHDMHGYLFIRDLASNLADRGIDVTYVTCLSVETPNQESSRLARGASTIQIRLDERFEKYNVFKRMRAELDYGRRLSAAVKRVRPNVVLTANGPLLSQLVLARAARSVGAAFAFWVQDLYAPAAQQMLNERLPSPVARLGAAPFAWLERRLLRRSDAVVTIGQSLGDEVLASGVALDRHTTIANWTDPSAIVPMDVATKWRQELGLEKRLVFLYTGTLGKKHPHKFLEELSRQVQALDQPAAVVVVSEGQGADILAEAASPTLRLLPYQPEDRLSEVLASADVLVLLLGVEASQYSMPSKLYSYFCAERPVLAAVPEGETADLVRMIGAGLVVDPQDAVALTTAIDRFADSATRKQMGARGREWAEREMDTDGKADQFAAVLHAAIRTHSGERL
jgi:colanic acid biosynthesis glycosyl transferase WcaI